MLKLQFVNQDHETVSLETGRVTIGRDGSNAVVLSSGGVSGFHAELQIENGTVQVVDLGSTNGTFVNNVRVTGKQTLEAWDTVRFDTVEAEIVDTAGRRPTIVNKILADDALSKTQVQPSMNVQKTQVVTNRPKLVCTAGSCKGESFEIDQERVSIGREDQNDVVLLDQTVSSKHAVLTLHAGAWNIEDLGSSNGTVINGQKIKTQVLEDGTELSLGKCVLRFELPRQMKKRDTIIIKLSEDPDKSEPEPEKPPFPSWVYGVAGFVVVLLVAWLIWPRSKPSIPLQGNTVWTQKLSHGRIGPSSPAVADINGDGVLDVIMGDSEGFLLALDGMKGLKIFEAETVDKVYAPIVTGDLTGDGLSDVVVCSRSGEVTAFNGEGKMLWKSGLQASLGVISNRPVLVDVSGDGVLDVIVPTENKGLVALDGTRGWVLWETQAMFKGKVITAPIAADLNQDGTMDFVAGTEDGHFVAVRAQGDKPLMLWEATVPAISYASPALVRTGGQEVVVVATKDNGVVALNAASGRAFWQVSFGKSFIASPIAVDGDGDGNLDVVLVATNGDVHVLNGVNGDEIWSRALGAGVLATPALYEATQDALTDLVVLDENGSLHVIDMARGKIVLSKKLDAVDGFAASPVLADVNNDQFLEVIGAAKNGQIVAFGLNLSLGKGAAPWPVFLGNDEHAAR